MKNVGYSHCMNKTNIVHLILTSHNYLKPILNLETIRKGRRLDCHIMAFNTKNSVEMIELVQLVSKIRLRLDFEWSKRGWVNGLPFCKKTFEIRTKTSGFQMVGSLLYLTLKKFHRTLKV